MSKKVSVPGCLLKKLEETSNAIEDNKRKAETRERKAEKKYEEYLLAKKRKEKKWEEWFLGRPEEVIKAEAIIQWINENIFSNKELTPKLTALVDGWREYNIGSKEFYNIFSYFTGRVFSHNRREVIYISIWPKVSKIRRLYYTSGLFCGSRHEIDISSSRDMVRSLSSDLINKLHDHIKSGMVWESLQEEIDRIKKERIC